MNIKFRALIAASCVALSVSAPIVVLASSSNANPSVFKATVDKGNPAQALVDEGKANFSAKRFYAAEDCFNRAATADPGNQLVRYLIGQTLEQLYDSKAAKVAYMDCYRLNPFNAYGASAKKALEDLNARIEARTHEPADTIEQTQQTIEIIKRQSRQLQRNNIRNGYTQANWTIQAGNRVAAGVGDNNRYTYNDMRTGRRNYNNDDEFSTRDRIRSSWIRSDATSQALAHQALGYQRAREISNSAANLENLLAEHKKDGDAKLRALGTNLFVRYYGNSDHEDPTPPADPLIELRATEQKLQDLPQLKTQLKTTSRKIQISSAKDNLGR